MAEQIFAQGPLPLPATYTVPGTAEIVPLSVSASIDGTAASGPFVACCSFYSQAGHLIARVPTSSTLAAGDNAEVTWAPFLRSAQAAAAASGLPWAFMSRFFGISIASGTGYASISIAPGGANTTASSDTSIFTFAANLSGDYGIKILNAGLYVLIAEVSFRKATAATAGAAAGVAWTPASYYPVMAENVPFAQNPDGSGNFFATPGGAVVVNLDPGGTPPPRTYVLRAGQTSGATITAITASALAVQINPTGSNLF